MSSLRDPPALRKSLVIVQRCLIIKTSFFVISESVFCVKYIFQFVRRIRVMVLTKVISSPSKRHEFLPAICRIHCANLCRFMTNIAFRPPSMKKTSIQAPYNLHFLIEPRNLPPQDACQPRQPPWHDPFLP